MSSTTEGYKLEPIFRMGDTVQGIPSSRVSSLLQFRGVRMYKYLLAFSILPSAVVARAKYIAEQEAEEEDEDEDEDEEEDCGKKPCGIHFDGLQGLHRVIIQEATYAGLHALTITRALAQAGR